MLVSAIPVEAKAPIEEINRGLVWIFQEREKDISHKEYLYSQLFFKGEVFAYPIFNRIIGFESGWYEKAKNSRSSAKGFAQILDGTWKHFKCDGNPLNGFDNLDCALKIYSKNGFRDWCADRNSKRELSDICGVYD